VWFGETPPNLFGGKSLGGRASVLGSKEKKSWKKKGWAKKGGAQLFFQKGKKKQAMEGGVFRFF